jgi:hypothetical protein
VLIVSDLILENLYLFLSLCHINMSHSIIAIKYLGNLLQSGAFSLNEDEVDPDGFEDIPKLQTQCVLDKLGHQRHGKV